MSPRPSAPEPATPQFPDLPPRAPRKLSKREQIRIALRSILSRTWQPLWRVTRRFDKAWYALLLSGALAFGQMSHSAPSHANGSGVVATYIGGGWLVIDGTVGDDHVVLTVENGELKVNGGNPNTGVLSSFLVQDIYISMADGADTIDLSALRRADLGVGARVFGNTGGGDDTLALSPDIGGTFVDASGNDTLMITADGEIIYNDFNALVNNIEYTFNGFFEQAMLFGGPGDDILNAQTSNAQVTLNGGGGDDTLYGPIQGGAVFQLSPGEDILYNTSARRIELTADSDMTLTDAGITWGVNSATFNGFPELVLLTGGAGNNTIDAAGYSGMVQLDGAAGDDMLIGGSGSVTITGGTGADTVTPGAGSTHINDPSVADGDRLKLEGVYSATAQVAGDATTIVWSAAENQPMPYGTTFNGLFSEVSLLGTNENNVFLFGDYAGRTVLSGLGGNDVLTAGRGGGILDGGADDDTLSGGAGADEFRPGGGQNSLSDETAGDADVIVYTGTGNITLDATTLTTFDGSSTFNGFFEAALLTGDDMPNVINAAGFGGNATLLGLGGNDILADGNGDDTLKGGDGDDTIFVSLGNDSVIAGAGDDRVERRVTPPVIAVLQTAGDDTLDGGDGVDTLVQQADGTQTLTDTQLTGLGTAQISHFEAAELTGGAGDDTIDASGFGGNVVLRGLAGDDTLIGGGGDSVIEGGEGDDTITSGAGGNTIDGGPGVDTIDGVVEGGAKPEVFTVYVPLVQG